MYDLAIIGGGINGAGIARDAAGQGLRVLLLEQDDLAAHTSSASTKLIHGGLRYLEQFEFALVRKSLKERERLLAIAPHIVRPMRFVLPVDEGMRPAWMLRAGLWIYDHLAHRAILPGTQSHWLRDDPFGGALQPRLARGFSYSDCWVDDARLVVLNAQDAAARGANIVTRTRCTRLERFADRWHVYAGDRCFAARGLVNAAGPWVDAVSAMAGDTRQRVRLVKGSHIVVPRLYDGDHAYIFQNPDRRIVFAIPYEGRFTLIGTTDQPYGLAEGPPVITDAERAYLCAAASNHFRKPVLAESIIWTYAGVRPLFDDKSESVSRVTRDYMFDFQETGGAPFLQIFGGKLTTYRVLAKEAIRRFAPALRFTYRDWTAQEPLPGGDFGVGGFSAQLADGEARWPFLRRAVLDRLTRAYGTQLSAILGDAKDPAALGQDFGHGLYEAELRHLCRTEWAVTADDVLWRRSKLGLHMGAQQQSDVAEWMQSNALRD